MKAFLAFVLCVALLGAGLFFGRVSIINQFFPTTEIVSEEVGVVPHEFAVKEYWVSEPSELMVRIVHLQGTTGMITVSQEDDLYDWVPGESRPLPVQFRITDGRYSTEWFSARKGENFRVALGNIADDRFAVDGTLIRIVIYRRNALPPLIRTLVPEAYEMEGARVQAFDPDKDIDTETVMDFVFGMPTDIPD